MESVRASDMQVVGGDTQLEQTKRQRYNKYVACVSPQTSAAKSLLSSFAIGGLTCVIGQIIVWIYKSLLHVPDEFCGVLSLMTLILLAVCLTGIGVYDDIARIGGAGSFLPITGFANAMSSASIEFKTEGLVFGTSVKMFSIVGPVIVNGVVWSTVAALIRLIVTTLI